MTYLIGSLNAGTVILGLLIVLIVLSNLVLWFLCWVAPVQMDEDERLRGGSL